jgi:hypothetical protein
MINWKCEFYWNEHKYNCMGLSTGCKNNYIKCPLYLPQKKLKIFFEKQKYKE